VQRFCLTREQYLPLQRDRVFAFFADARNLELLTPRWLKFEVLTPGTVEMRPGTLIDYRLRLRGIPLRWQSEIAVWDPPHRFVDVQRRGPYRMWVHTHTFEERGSGTLVRDEVTYAVSGGRPVNYLFVAPDLARIFDYRARRLSAWGRARIARTAGASSEPATAGY
jgi:ligand-binding SRPBCC domain-containing protein